MIKYSKSKIKEVEQDAEKGKTREHLIKELAKSRQQVSQLEKSETERRQFEEVAHEARSFSESIVETIREPLLVLDGELKVLSANRSFYHTFKVTPDETIGNFIYDLGNRQWNIPRLRILLEEILPRETVFNNFEVEHDFSTIGRKIMLLNARRIFQEKTGSHMILLAIEDITELKRIENKLKESEERYRHLFETSKDGLLLIDKEDERIIAFNSAILELLGYSNEEFLGKKFDNIGLLKDVGDFGKIRQQLNKIGFIHIPEIVVMTKKGKNICTEIFIVDRAKEFQCNVRDLTERKRAQEAKHESEVRFRSIFEQSPIAIEVYNAHGRLVDANHACLEIFGVCDIRHILGFDLFGDPNIPDDAKKRFAQGETVSFESVFDFGLVREKNLYPTTRSGICYIDCMIHPLLDINNKFTGYIVHVRDITKRKGAEENLRRMNERFTLATNAAGLGVWDWDLQKNELTWDDRMYALYGLKKEDFTGAYEAWLKGVHPEDRAISDEISKLALCGEREYDTEFRVVWPDGSIHRIKAYGQIVRNADNNHCA